MYNFIKSVIKVSYVIAVVLFMTFLLLVVIGFFQVKKNPDLEVLHNNTIFKENFDYTDFRSFQEYLDKEKIFFDKVYKILEHSRSDPKYIPGSDSNPNGRGINKNRSSLNKPLGESKGVALVVHGLSDSPYHMLNIVDILLSEGYTVLNFRLPGHGTAPGALVSTNRSDWIKAYDFAVKMSLDELKRSEGDKFIAVGFSTGGALILNHLSNQVLNKGDFLPDKVFLFSPATSITKIALFADFHDYISWIPGLESFKWMDILKEDDPYKYNSFPKNAAYQIYKLTQKNKKLLIKYLKRKTIYQAYYKHQERSQVHKLS